MEKFRQFFAEGPDDGQPFIYGDSSGYVGIAVRNGNAAKTLGVGFGAPLALIISETISHFRTNLLLHSYIELGGCTSISRLIALDIELSVLYATITSTSYVYTCRFRLPSRLRNGTEIETKIETPGSSSSVWCC